MANILTAVKEGMQSYYDKVYSHSSFNQMWILKYCKYLLDRLNAHFFYLVNWTLSQYNCIPSFDSSQNVSHIYKQLLCWKSRSTCSILFCIWFLVKFCYSIYCIYSSTNKHVLNRQLSHHYVGVPYQKNICRVRKAHFSPTCFILKTPKNPFQ
jgi:hypothetical protein